MHVPSQTLHFASCRLVMQERLISLNLKDPAQDDDFLINRSILHALHHHIHEQPGPHRQIHLLPPSDHLGTTLQTVSVPNHITTSPAWLGYGTMLTRATAVSFLELLHDPEHGFTADEKRMADNYFTILRNHIPEVWMYSTHSLDPSAAFTVGTEGDERNYKYTVCASQLMQSKKLCF